MKIETKELNLKTKGAGELIDITDMVAKELMSLVISVGIVTAAVEPTSLTVTLP